jgi:Flp pilus assembly protein TadD
MRRWPWPFLPALLLAVVIGGGGCRLAADGNNLQGVREFQSGNYGPAMQRFQTAATMDPGNADAVYNMAATMHRQGIQSGDRNLLNQAEVVYNQALDLNKNHMQAYRGLAVLLNETDRPDKAFKLLKNWVAASPRDPNARIELARLYEEYGDLASAKIHLLDAMQLDPGNPRVHLAFGHIREREGDYSQAMANYQRSYTLSRNPAVQDRIAALNRVVAGGGTAPAAGGTRTVQGNSGGWNARY